MATVPQKVLGTHISNIYFWILFTILHIITCFILTAQLYYLGNWKFDKGMVRRRFQIIANDFRSGPLNILKPLHRGRMVLLILGNIVNWLLAGYGLYKHEKDFALYLLAILLCNTMLYFLFYLVMKVLHKEKINVQTILFLTLMLTCAVSAMYFFIHKSISWELTPARSRRYNQECKVFQFYDYHDVWHFLSATGMFFTFMVLLTLDDDLSHTHRSKISVF
ncbi:SID1 transmembrane family member 2-like [Agrilus planipennis]|uniref:SID1 transmembrane family member 2-like n=1 Tax=Agrilus planipennis TaxID=224129 RepID=A0A7F5RHP7_AGRPL|nr:SID1 transmembrane family member 2-like [Agrilus planipennis]